MKLWRPSRAGVTEFERTTEPDSLRHICKLVALGNHPLGTVGYDCMAQPQRASQPPAGILCLSDPQYHAVAPCAGVQRECLPSFEAVAECGRMGGNLLNLILYMPYGTTSWQWKRKGKKIVAIGFALSVFCEALQYLTGRGMADVNDVLFNTLGTLAGLCIAKRLATVYKGNIIKNLIMDCQSYTKYRPNETTGGIFVSWRRKEELPTGA